MKTVRPKAKDRIVETSARLFYAHDTHAIGVDTVCKEANVSKRTLYKYFPTKEKLVAAGVVAQAEAWNERVETVDSNDPKERIVGIFKILEKQSQSADFHGCPMMNTSIELRDSDTPARAVAKGFKDQLFSYLHEQAALLKVQSPEVLAQQLLLLYDGCNAWIVMRRSFPASVYDAVEKLLAA